MPSIDDSQLVPDQVLDERYKIYTLLGGGGQGEVYRADDMKLGKFVALKVLHAKGREERRRLRLEARVAQEVSHPNVCRVHDIGAFGKHVYLSMEYVDGEDLGSILHREVGSLGEGEKLSIAYQLCAGLQAIHEAGVVHRDLKPGNVMIGGRGRVVISDFGLAEIGAGIPDPKSGTWRYMAPEQLAGEGVSQKSDLYALGLLLFELFCGKSPFSARCPEELMEVQRQKLAFPAQLKPEVKEAIRQCLQPLPQLRPASPWAVADLLPGDIVQILHPVDGPPQPESLLLVPRGNLGRRAAWSCLLAIIAALLLLATFGSRAQVVGLSELSEPPAVLERLAREVLAELGRNRPDWDSMSGFSYDDRAVRRIANQDSSPDRWSGLAGSRADPVDFWYRQSPDNLLPLESGRIMAADDDPPANIPGMTTVRLDVRGRLRSFEAIVITPALSSVPTLSPDQEPPLWSALMPPLFTAAGLDFEPFRRILPVDPLLIEGHLPAASWMAWEGPDRPESSHAMRVEAAVVGSRVVGFRVFELRSRETLREQPRLSKILGQVGQWVTTLWFTMTLLLTLVWTQHNLRRRRADTTTALRLVILLLIIRGVVWLLGAHHLHGLDGVRVFRAQLAWALYDGALAWLIYIALEPHLRRHWPERLASWARLVRGRIFDPLVGRDVLIGIFGGIAAVLSQRLYALAPAWLGMPPPRPDLLQSLIWQRGSSFGAFNAELEALRGFRHALAIEVLVLERALLLAFCGVVGALMLRTLLPARWMALVSVMTLFTAVWYPVGAGHPLFDLLMAAIATGLWLLVLVRYGFLAVVVTTATAWLLNSHPLTLDFESWYFNGSAAVLLTIALAACSAFWVALAGRSPLPEIAVIRNRGE